MDVTAPEGVTNLLLDWGGGDEQALDAMLPLVYDELRRLAGHYMRSERPDHTLQPTALVHEAYLRLIDQRRVDWRNRAQFLGMAARMMRRVLVNHARDRAAAKRGGGAEHVTLSLSSDGLDPPDVDVDVVALHQALERLAARDPIQGRVVELKFFGGLTIQEIGEVVDLSHVTIERHWKFARAWLFSEMADAAPGSPP